MTLDPREIVARRAPGARPWPRIPAIAWIALFGGWFLLSSAPARAQGGQDTEDAATATEPPDAGPTTSPSSVGGDDAGSDSGAPLLDAGVSAAALLDAGSDDAGSSDAGSADAGSTDGLSSTDGGFVELLEEEATEHPIHDDGHGMPTVDAETTEDVVRTLLGLVALLALAWLGGHERIRQFEERIGIAQVMTSGFPFVLLGLIAQAPGVDILNDQTVARLTPVLQFGLGWIGFHTGFQLDSRAASVVPRGTATVVILLTALPFLLITALAGAALWGLGLASDHVMLTRDAVMIGLAGALSAPTLARLVQASNPRAIQLVQTMSLLDDVVVVVAFACLAAWLRPAGGETGWVLPAVGWVFVTFGMAAVLGLLTDIVLRGTDSRAEKTSLLLGVVALTAGMAAIFQLSALVVCFLAGVLFRNLPASADRRQIEDAFGRLERPVYHLFLIIVGALWRPELIAGWLVLPLFLIARTLGRFLAARIARSLPPEARPTSLADTPDADLVLPPIGQLAIAFVITAQTLYESAAVRAMVTAVIGGSIVMEIVVQLGARRRSSPPASRATTTSSSETGEGGAA